MHILLIICAISLSIIAIDILMQRILKGPIPTSRFGEINYADRLAGIRTAVQTAASWLFGFVTIPYLDAILQWLTQMQLGVVSLWSGILLAVGIGFFSYLREVKRRKDKDYSGGTT